MNKRQLIALWLGIGLLVLMGIFPPWVRHERSYSNFVLVTPCGHHPIFSPPHNLRWESFNYKLDISLLLIQVGIVTIVTGGAIVSLKTRKASSNLATETRRVRLFATSFMNRYAFLLRRILFVLQWILFLPCAAVAAVGGAIIGFAPVLLVTWLFHIDTHEMPMQHIEIEVVGQALGWFFGVFSFVAIGSIVSPAGYRAATASALSRIFIILSVIGLLCVFCEFFYDKNNDYFPITIASLISSILGSYFAWQLIKNIIRKREFKVTSSCSPKDKENEPLAITPGKE